MLFTKLENNDSYIHTILFLLISKAKEKWSAYPLHFRATALVYLEAVRLTLSNRRLSLEKTFKADFITFHQNFTLGAHTHFRKLSSVNICTTVVGKTTKNPPSCWNWPNTEWYIRLWCFKRQLIKKLTYHRETAFWLYDLTVIQLENPSKLEFSKSLVTEVHFEGNPICKYFSCAL